MKNDYTEEERRFIEEYPDYPWFVIAEAFEKKFNKKTTKRHVNLVRLRSRGSSNRNHPNAKKTKSNTQNRIVENLMRRTFYFEKTDVDGGWLE